MCIDKGDQSMAKVQQILGAMGIKSPSKAKQAAKATAAVVSKPAAKVEAKGAEALAAQNKAMIKMENPRSLKATSGYGNEGW